MRQRGGGKKSKIQNNNFFAMKFNLIPTYASPKWGKKIKVQEET